MSAQKNFTQSILYLSLKGKQNLPERRLSNICVMLVCFAPFIVAESFLEQCL